MDHSSTSPVFAPSIALALGFVAAGHGVVASASGAPIDFNRDVRPILAEKCLACHGGVKQAGGVSFVYRERAFGVGDSGRRIVVAGDAEASELVHRISTDDPDDRMPPPDEHPEGLTPGERETLRRWVEEGASWSRHWAFEVPRLHDPPAVVDDGWGRTGIDPFVLADLEGRSIVPAPEEEPDLWLRRVSLDLVGLPPSPDERDAFLAAVARDGEAAFSAAVDRLLGSPHFGERWASVWLDQVRYADSQGLGIDRRRNVWQYRDWVVDAFNRDLPYDRFTIAQIAGDLLPGAAIGDLVATTNQRLTQTNDEGGTDDEEFRVAAVLDRVDTTWQTWQAVTFGCVQCHSHPYDPFPHEDYYRFMAFFNNTRDCDLGSEEPNLAVPLREEDEERARALDEEMRTLRHDLWRRGFDLLADGDRWRPLGDMEATTDNETVVEVVPAGPRDEFRTVDTVFRNTTITLELPLPDGMDALTAVRFTGMPLDPAAAARDSEWGFVLSHVEAHLVPPDGGEPAAVPFASVIGDDPEPNHDPGGSLDAKSNEGFGPFSRMNRPRSAAFVLAEPMRVPSGAVLRVALRHRVFLYGSFPLVTRRGHLAVSDDPSFTAWLLDPRRVEASGRLAALEEERASIPSVATPVMRERPGHLARPSHIFIRGNFLTKGDPVEPGVPELLGPFDPRRGDRGDRLDLAHWLVDPANPLTARVAVNRFWARIFGTGLVATEEDFGSSGEEPSHPELLDTLAVRFREEFGWSVKRLLREIVLSSTYRQSGRTRPELSEADAPNRLLARGPRIRLPAETIRDQALAVSGLLDRTVHGPPVQPPLPEGVWKPFDGEKWPDTAPGDPSRYRRSIYTYLKRSIPYPMFASFDAPSREFCTPRRLRSNTPLQALVTLNDATFAECARALGERLAGRGGSLADQVRWGFVAATSREPDDGEIEALVALYRNAYEQAAPDPSVATPEAISSARRMAFSQVGSVLLNLDEIFAK